MNAPEFDRKITISISLAMVALAACFWLTREYMEIKTLQKRIEYVNDRITRTDADQAKQIEEIRKMIGE